VLIRRQAQQILDRMDTMLLLAEAEYGLLTHWELVCGNSEHDAVVLKRSPELEGPRRELCWSYVENASSQVSQPRATPAWRPLRQIARKSARLPL